MERPKGCSKREAMRLWAVTEYRLNLLERDGKLHGLQVGQKVFFSRAELEHLLGEPNGGGPSPRRRHNSRGDVSGEQLSWPEIGNAAAAA